MRCIEACPADALTFQPTLAVDAGRCTRCMLCAAACPTEALGTAGVSAATVGCEDAHAWVPCLGILADEDLVALADRGPVRLLTGPCSSCRNGFVVAILERKLARLGLAGKVVLSRRGAEWSRRAFFGAWFHAPPARTRATASKRVPERRRRLRPGAYDYHVELLPHCNGCRRCVATCPTGALRNLEFDARLCVGCDVCADCCPLDAVRITRGVQPREAACTAPAT
jgi:ferredoxin